MSKILVIVGTTRPGRASKPIAEWVMTEADTRGAHTYELADLKDIDLPFLDEPVLAAVGDYRHEHTQRWAEMVGEADGIVIVTPEYNHGYPAALKNALDYLYAEWNHKPVAFVSHSAVSAAGIRAVEQLLPVVLHLKMQPVSSKVHIPNTGEQIDDDRFTPSKETQRSLHNTLNELEEALVARHVGVR